MFTKGIPVLQVGELQRGSKIEKVRAYDPRGFDEDYGCLVESDDFKKHMLLSISEFFENVDVFYLSALRDKDNGSFHCFREKESSDDFIASSFFVADIDGLNTVWRKELNNSGDVYLDNERLCQRNMLYLLKCYTF